MTLLFKNRFWMTLETGKSPESPRFGELGNGGETVSLPAGFNFSDSDSGPFFKNVMRGITGVMVYEGPDECKIITDAYGMLPVFCYGTGEKRYYFTHFPDLLEALPDITLSPDPVGIWEAMLYDVIFGTRTIFREIRMLPPSSVITVDAASGSESMERYDHLEFGRIEGKDLEEAGRRVAELLKGVLSKMTGERFLLPLSGGVDSRVLAAAAAAVFGSDRITALSFACRPSSYEFVYARKTCEILGIKDWRGHILTQDSYLRSLRVFPERFGGNLSISHGHLYDALQANRHEFQGMTLLSGAFADAAGGYHAEPPEMGALHVEESHNYRHVMKLDEAFCLKGVRDMVIQDIKDNFSEWRNGSTIETFDEYAYVTNRQPRVLFMQSLLYQDILKTEQPFTDPALSTFLFGLPYEMRAYKRGVRAAIKHLSGPLYRLPDISSKMIQDAFRDRLHIYRGKVINNLCRLATLATGDRHMFFSPYQTECQDYNLRVAHRKLVHGAVGTLKDYGVIDDEQCKVLSSRPNKQFGGGVMPCAQYWAITIAEALRRFCK